MIKKILPLALAISCMNVTASELPSTKEALLDRFLTAHEAKSYENISSLINWEGVRKYKQKMIRVYTRNNFGRKVIGTEFEEADTEFLNNFSVGHKKYQSNLPVTHLMRIYFEDTVGDEEPEFGSVVYLVGKHKEGYQIAIATKNPSSPPTQHH
ncbi:hypothetical protein ACMXYR_05310 [Neptuniibacter sp. QD29_5]|uniref:hypothetical protein n=1 Tax=unclassified Neptuniibacter TaxID=2630693 RepID=UPI0039F6CB97